jgi:hypothetical protein
MLLPGCKPFEHLDITTTALRDGKVGQTYADTIRTSGGSDPVSVRLFAGQLPPGIGLRPRDDYAVLSGTPALAGQYLFTVEARDQSDDTSSWHGETVARGFVITVQP